MSLAELEMIEGLSVAMDVSEYVLGVESKKKRLARAGLIKKMAKKLIEEIKKEGL